MAREILAYLSLFEGRITLTEILNMDYSLLMEMVKIKNAEVEQRNKEMKAQRENMENMTKKSGKFK